MRYQFVATTLMVVAVAAAWGATTARVEGQGPPAVGSLQGTVVGVDGQPVPGVTVSAQFGPEQPQAAPMPVAVTDASGLFTYRDLPAGRYQLFAEKVEAGFPSTALAIFQEGPLEDVIVEVPSGGTVSGVVVRFGPPFGVLTGQVIDDATETPIPAALLRVTRPDAPDAFLSTSLTTKAEFVLACPERPLVLEVSAPGYVTWRGDIDGDEPIVMPHGARRSMVVRLRHP